MRDDETDADGHPAELWGYSEGARAMCVCVCLCVVEGGVSPVEPFCAQTAPQCRTYVVVAEAGREEAPVRAEEPPEARAGAGAGAGAPRAGGPYGEATAPRAVA